MNAMQRLCIAEGVQGGVIHTYNRMFSNALGRQVDCTYMGPDELATLARECLAKGAFDAAKMASKASIAHLQFAK